MEKLRKELCTRYVLQEQNVELSMGMSGDYLEAVTT